MTIQCDACGKFLGFAELAFSAFHFTPLNEFGPEESSWTGPCCRWRDTPASATCARSAETEGLSPKDASAVGAEGDETPTPNPQDTPNAR